MRLKSLALALTVPLTLGACVSQPEKIQSSYISPSTYAGRNCNQLMSERNEIVGRVNMLTAQQKKAANNDAVATGVALLLFWPAAFALAASNDSSTALSSAKGHYDAVTQQMRTQGCKMPPEPIQPVMAKAGGSTATEAKRSWE